MLNFLMWKFWIGAGDRIGVRRGSERDNLRYDGRRSMWPGYERRRGIMVPQRDQHHDRPASDQLRSSTRRSGLLNQIYEWSPHFNSSETSFTVDMVACKLESSSLGRGILSSACWLLFVGRIYQTLSNRSP